MKFVAYFTLIGLSMLNFSISPAQIDKTPSFLAYLSSLIEQKIVGEDELITLIEDSQKSRCVNPISTERAQISVNAHIAHVALDKLLQESIDHKQLIPWLLERVSEETKKKVKRNDIKDNTQSVWKHNHFPIACGAEHSCATQSDMTVICWGSNSHGQANPPDRAMTPTIAQLYHLLNKLLALVF